MRLHRHRQLGSGHAAAGPQRKGGSPHSSAVSFTLIERTRFCLSELLCGQDAVHLRLGQAEALHAVGENVLRQRSGHWRLSQQTHQSDFQTVEEEAIAEKCRL